VAGVKRAEAAKVAEPAVVSAGVTTGVTTAEFPEPEDIASAFADPELGIGEAVRDASLSQRMLQTTTHGT